MAVVAALVSRAQRKLEAASDGDARALPIVLDAFTWQDMQRLHDRGCTMYDSQLGTWMCTDLYAHPAVVFPVAEGGHWYFVLLDVEQHTAVVVDSLSTTSAPSPRTAARCIDFMKRHHVFKFGIEDPKPWTVLPCTDTPQQSDARNCGIFTIVGIAFVLEAYRTFAAQRRSPSVPVVPPSTLLLSADAGRARVWALGMVLGAGRIMTWTRNEDDEAEEVAAASSRARAGAGAGAGASASASVARTRRGDTSTLADGRTSRGGASALPADTRVDLTMSPAAGASGGDARVGRGDRSTRARADAPVSAAVRPQPSDDDGDEPHGHVEEHVDDQELAKSERNLIAALQARNANPLLIDMVTLFLCSGENAVAFALQQVFTRITEDERSEGKPGFTKDDCALILRFFSAVIYRNEGFLLTHHGRTDRNSVRCLCVERSRGPTRPGSSCTAYIAISASGKFTASSVHSHNPVNYDARSRRYAVLLATSVVNDRFTEELVQECVSFMRHVPQNAILPGTIAAWIRSKFQARQLVEPTDTYVARVKSAIQRSLHGHKDTRSALVRLIEKVASIRDHAGNRAVYTTFPVDEKLGPVQAFIWHDPRWHGPLGEFSFPSGSADRNRNASPELVHVCVMDVTWNSNNGLGGLPHLLVLFGVQPPQRRCIIAAAFVESEMALVAQALIDFVRRCVSHRYAFAESVYCVTDESSALLGGIVQGLHNAGVRLAMTRGCAWHKGVKYAQVIGGPLRAERRNAQVHVGLGGMLAVSDAWWKDACEVCGLDPGDAEDDDDKKQRLLCCEGLGTDGRGCQNVVCLRCAGFVALPPVDTPFFCAWCLEVPGGAVRGPHVVREHRAVTPPGADAKDYMYWVYSAPTTDLCRDRLDELQRRFNVDKSWIDHQKRNVRLFSEAAHADKFSGDITTNSLAESWFSQVKRDAHVSTISMADMVDHIYERQRVSVRVMGGGGGGQERDTPKPGK